MRVHLGQVANCIAKMAPSVEQVVWLVGGNIALQHRLLWTMTRVPLPFAGFHSDLQREVWVEEHPKANDLLVRGMGRHNELSNVW